MPAGILRGSHLIWILSLAVTIALAGCANKRRPSEGHVRSLLETARNDMAVVYGQGGGVSGFVEYSASPGAAVDAAINDFSDPDAIVERHGRKYVIKPGTYLMNISCSVRDGLVPFGSSGSGTGDRKVVLEAGNVYQLDGKLRAGSNGLSKCFPVVRNLTNWGRRHLK